MTVSIELDYDQIDEVIVKGLKEIHSSLSTDLTNVTNSNKGFVFNTNPAEDIRQLNKLIKSISRVLKFYGSDV